MKRNLFLFLSLILITAGCEKLSIDEIQSSSSEDCFYASFDAPLTKAYWDDDNLGEVKLFWSKNDTISIFKTSTHNSPYVFQGSSGSRTGSFAVVPADDFFVCEDLQTNFAVYPFSSKTEFDTQTGLISFNMPTKQNGNGKSNVMVAVTPSSSDRELKFKNACGYIFFRLFGGSDNQYLRVRSVTIRGNNSEVLSGPCTISASADNAPVLRMTTTSSALSQNPSFRTLCMNSTKYLYGDTVTIGFAIPPTTFANGFTMTVTDGNGHIFEKTVTGSKSISRNVVNWMDPIEVVYGDQAAYAIFEDQNLESYMLRNFDIDGDGLINSAEASFVETIQISNSEPITSISGLEFFPNLHRLTISQLTIESLDLRPLANLEYAYFGNQSLIASIDCSGLTHLSDFRYYRSTSGANTSTLEGINLDGCTALTRLNLYNHSHLSTLDISSNTALTYLYCYNDNLTSLDISHNTALSNLVCDHNKLTNLINGSNTSLKTLDCSENQLTTLDISGCSNLQALYVDNNQLPSLALNSNSNLRTLYCYNNQLTNINLSNCSGLQSLSCQNNQLSSLNLSDCSNLQLLYCYDNQITTLSLNCNSSLRVLSGARNQLTSLDLSGYTALETLDLEGVLIITIPDESKPFDKDYNPIGTLSSLNISGCSSLRSLSCQYQKLLGELTLSDCTELEYLNLCWCNFTSIDISHNLKLTSLHIGDNNLTTIDLANHHLITSLGLNNNPFTQMPQILHLTGLTELHLCSIARYMSNDYLQNFPHLESVNFSGYNQGSIDLSHNSSLKYVWCGGMENLTVLDFSNCAGIRFLDAVHNNSLNEVILPASAEMETLTLDNGVRVTYR